MKVGDVVRIGNYGNGYACIVDIDYDTHFRSEVYRLNDRTGAYTHGIITLIAPAEQFETEKQRNEFVRVLNRLP